LTTGVKQVRLLKILMPAWLIGIAVMLVLPSAAAAAWHRAETDHFIFYGTSAKDIREDAIRLERYDALLRTLTNIPKDSDAMKLTVYVLSDTDAVQRAYGGKDRDVAGFYSTTPSGVLAVVPRGIGEKEYDDVILFHEYAHHLMLHYFPTAYPAWYVEGFAEYLGTAQFTDKFAKIGLPANHRGYELMIDQTIPIETLLSANVGDLRRDQVGNFYGRAWLLTHYLSFEKARSGQQSQCLKFINDGMSPLEAARKAFGDLAVLNKDLERYLRASKISYLNIPNVPPSETTITVRELDRASGEALIDQLLLTRGTAKVEQQPIANRLRKLSGKYSGHAGVLTLLAEAEHDLGNYDAAVLAADAAIAVEPTNVRALLWKGSSLMRTLTKAKEKDPAKWKGARSWIVKANRANPQDPLPLFEYYQSFQAEGRDPTKSAIAGLGKAVSLIPQESAFRIPYALELAEAEDYAFAAIILQPIANSPHNSFAKSARILMTRLRAAAANPGEKVDLSALLAELNKDDEASEKKPPKPPVPPPPAK
jgi:tetratricopeptide (TPR) repeat protein